MTEAGDALVTRIAGFGQYLRTLGLPIGTAQTIDFVRAVLEVRLAPEDFRLAARATFVSRPEDLLVFESAFDQYWRTGLSTCQALPGGLSGDQDPSRTSVPPDADAQALKGPQTHWTHLATTEEEPSEAVDANSDGQTIYSAVEILREKDFSQFTDEELALARTLMERQRWRLGDRTTRRTVRSRRGPHLDTRRLLRSSLGNGEQPGVARRRQKLRPRPIVAICDISGSMDRYSRMLLQFLHIVAHGRSPLEVFVFGTRLTRVTRQLRARDGNDALAAAAVAVSDWSGGTRIGESLHAFNKQWSQRVLRGGATVLLISDGWDRGDPQLLGVEMARLQRNAHRLIWLTPLLGSQGYEPMTRGILAALPYADDFLPVHNLKTLDALATVLAAVTDRRPARSP
ncbi:MAG: VWA domain-containing protein [Chloroflexota bacterium]|nr:VWA domain-containing protein [Chloroflexota bacterium]